MFLIGEKSADKSLKVKPGSSRWSSRNARLQNIPAELVPRRSPLIARQTPYPVSSWCQVGCGEAFLGIFRDPFAEGQKVVESQDPLGPDWGASYGALWANVVQWKLYSF